MASPRWTAALACLLVATLLAPAAAAQTSVMASETVQVNALAVGQTPEGLRGSAATVQVRALEGEGHVFVETRPLAQTDMQGSARLAAQVAAATVGESREAHDLQVVFRSETNVIGGPSAGAVMALGMSVALWNLRHPDEPWRLDSGVGVTGTINPDGTVGPVGGIPEKAEGAAEAGLETFLYPAGQTHAVSPATDQEVDMDTHCRELGIECHAVATLPEVLERAAGVRLERPEAPAPETAQYEAALRPGVQAELDELSQRTEETTRALEASGLQGERRQLVDSALETASDRQDEAQEAFDAARYYESATRAFQGAIFARHAALLVPFLQGDPERADVEAAVADCQEAVAAAREPAFDASVDDFTDLYAVGAAQLRVETAARLAVEAEAALEGAFRLEDWVASLQRSAFCLERTGTVSFWLSLSDAADGDLGAGDQRALYEESRAQATELVGYATAVVGGAPEATRLLEQAVRMARDGATPAAIAYAVEAQTAASVAVQAGAAGTVPDSILDAARQSAAQAIDRARQVGAEPILSVSLLELSKVRDDPMAALGDLWTARNLALLAADPLPAGSVEPVTDPQRADVLLLATVVGSLAVASAAGAVAAAWVHVRRR